MRIELLDDKEEYKRLHKLVFGRSDIDVPDVVHVGVRSDGVTVGFVAGFWLANNHFYIQWAGVLPEYQKRGHLRYFKSTLKDDATYDMAIRNDNLVTLKTVLSVGFIPIGCIMKENKLYIQVQRGPKDG
jgi:hypothetical protein